MTYCSRHVTTAEVWYVEKVWSAGISTPAVHRFAYRCTCAVEYYWNIIGNVRDPQVARCS